MKDKKSKENHANRQTNSSSPLYPGGIVLKDVEGKQTTYYIEGSTDFSVVDLSVLRDVQDNLVELKGGIKVLQSEVKDLEKWKWLGIGSVFVMVVIYFLKLAINVYKS